jgi:predicted flap endonuclease-1-like 5' DNA nuclease
MFKTKGFSSNNSLKRRAIIVDAPDLPPEECEFFITSAGIADSDKVEIPDIQNSPVLNFEVETLYEEDSGESDSHSESVPLTDVKGIGKGTAENLKVQGVYNLSDLLTVNPEELSSSMSGVSSKMVNEWKKSAEALMKT